MMKTPDQTEQQLDDLELVLQAQLETNRRLLEAIELKRQALRTADIDAIGELCRAEQEIVDRAGELERRRMELVFAITVEQRGADAAPLTMAQLADSLDEPRRARMCSLGDELRSSAQETRRRSAVVRDAAEALNRHLIGIMQLATAALSRARIYGAGGRIDVGSQHPACVDLRS